MKINYGSLTNDMEQIISVFKLRRRFPLSAIKSCKDICCINKEDYKGRRDLTSDLIFTIDGEDSKDFDDAVSINKNAKGYVLGVHIADVAHYVAPNSALDKEAYLRGTSVYLPLITLPMLPEPLSNGVCSLSENNDRLTLSVIMHIDFKGDVLHYEIAESVIKSKARLSYKQAAQIIEGELMHSVEGIKQALTDMQELCGLLIKKKHKRGAVEIETHEPQFSFCNGEITEVKCAPKYITHNIIEEFMVLTNSVIAKHFSDMKIPFVYRAHAQPPIEKVQRLKDFLASVGMNLRFEDKPMPKDFAKLISGADEEIKQVVSMMVLRSMSKADYRSDCTGHFGLALKYYCHFTSPIRRYPDLLIHRIIKAAIKNKSAKHFGMIAKAAAAQSSYTERVAEDAERKADALLLGRHMEKFIGEAFDGVISGVCDFGVFVVLENTAEGLIRVETLKGAYRFNEKSLMLKGAFTFRMGQRIRIRVESVNESRIAFSFVSLL